VHQFIPLFGALRQQGLNPIKLTHSSWRSSTDSSPGRRVYHYEENSLLLCYGGNDHSQCSFCV